MTTISANTAATVAMCLSARRPSPATMTIFGAGGDLTKRLIMPALYNLVRADRLPDGSPSSASTISTRPRMSGGRPDRDDANLRARRKREERARRSTSRCGSSAACIICAETFNPTPSASSESCWPIMKRQNGTTNVLFYLAVADRFFGPVIEQLGRAGLTDNRTERGGG